MPAVVVDTMVASAWLDQRPSPRKERWRPVLAPVGWVLPFPVVAEMRFGAEIAGWGVRRRAALERLVGRTRVIPPISEVIGAYVDLRTWATRAGHGIGAKDHEADRWVAAVAIAAGLPLATDDSIFDGIGALQRAWPAQ
jgi:predicted nucleic acid-binding protein